MKAIEIVEKLKSVLLSAEEPKVELAEEVAVEEIEVNEPTELAEDEEMPSEDSVEESPEEMKYATKEELEAAMAEMRAMYAQIIEEMGSEKMETEVPAQELSKEEEVELSAEAPVEPIAHSPEVAESAKLNFFKQNRPQTTQGVVYQKMFNK